VETATSTPAAPSASSAPAAPSAPNRREALKARHRQAILVAARQLVRQRGGRGFGVADLAERADVSPRTVFNHFVSLEDVVLATCADEVSAIVDRFNRITAARPPADGALETMTAAMRDTDIPPAISYFWQAFAGSPCNGSKQLEFFAAALTRAEQALGAAAQRSYPQADPLQLELLAGTLVHGLAIIANQWIEATGGSLDAASRRTWNTLFERFVTSVGGGFHDVT
jgi:AcrR family transcriptional regulator